MTIRSGTESGAVWIDKPPKACPTHGGYPGTLGPVTQDDKRAAFDAYYLERELKRHHADLAAYPIAPAPALPEQSRIARLGPQGRVGGPCAHYGTNLCDGSCPACPYWVPGERA